VSSALITDILDRAARQCSVAPPSSWVSGRALEHEELVDFLAEAAADVLDRVDVAPGLAAQQTIVGAGGPGSYSLGSSFIRLVRGAGSVFEPDLNRRFCIPVMSEGDWLRLVEDGSAGADRYFRVLWSPGGWSIEFFRPLETGQRIIVSYISDNWIFQPGPGGGLKAEFTALSDVSMIPRRIMESGVVWRFRERKGLEFLDKKSEYEALLARMSNEGRTRRTVNFGARAQRWPFDVPVPDFIPPT
jgi:hypothetical protein